MRKSFCAFVVAAAALTLAGGTARADVIALTGFSGGLDATSGADQLYGWIFSTSAPITVTALGVGDVNGILADSHDVGIFDDTSQSLLLSTTVPAGAPVTLIDGFDYVSVAPYSLPAGVYVIVMTMPDNTADVQSIVNTSVTTSAPVTYVNSAFDSGSTLAFPTDDGAFAEGLFGPNFTFQTASVPEPASAPVILVCGLGLIYLRRRRRHFSGSQEAI